MDQPLAHIAFDPKGERRVHLLVDHLRCVAELAATFGRSFGATETAYLAGLWHDLGKYRPGFRKYILFANDSDAHIEARVASSDKSHSAAGALHAKYMLETAHGPRGALLARALMYVIAGHHAGLADWTAGLDSRLFGDRKKDSDREYNEARNSCTDPALLALPDRFDPMAALHAIPGLSSGNPLAASLWIRMLFSSLIDADFLDTDRFMNPARFAKRTGFAPLATYLAQLDQYLDGKRVQVAAEGRAGDPVMVERAHVLQMCRDKADLPPGVFSLTVPTGGGKTLSSLAFALKHAVRNEQRRVIYAIPYTSIIEQTADVFGGIFGADNLVEHHSQFDATEDRQTHRSRLACENWDAPLVVTTNVQLFESLFAARTGRCRKLHNIADSVIVLDEAQLLPPAFLQPILDVLRLLVEHYGVTLVLCTATQPTLGDIKRFDPRRSLRGLPTPTPIINDHTRLFDALRRVDLTWPADLNTPTALPEIATDLLQHLCVLAIVNTRADAVALVQALDALTGDTGALHLSASMCGAHRSRLIGEIRARLQARRDGTDPRPLRVVSTQLVEAGVDVDFPVVYRALAGLDSIAQAAGRCNREGRSARGLVRVFVNSIPTTMDSVVRGAETTRNVLVAGAADALAPATFERYFSQYYPRFNLDEKQIVERLGEEATTLTIPFRSVAEDFQLIDPDGQASVIVPYAGLDEASLAQLRSGAVEHWLLRKAQRFTVNVRPKQALAWLVRGDVTEPAPGVFVLRTDLLYHPRFGLLRDGQPLDAGALVT